MMSAINLIKDHEKIQQRFKETTARTDRLKKAFSESKEFKLESLTLLCVGSLARKEIGNKSDMDVFLINQDDGKPISKLKELRILAELLKINESFKFPEFSNDGEYLKVYSLEEMTQKTGSPKDDFENLFTARMLLLLERKCLYNERLYENALKKVVNNYFRDNKGKSSFKPLFLLNDILRYWRTLCLNYEQKRNDAESPWRKKNISLKFSRKLTVFATILPIIARPMSKEEDVLDLMKYTPIERMGIGLDYLKDEKPSSDFTRFLDIYEEFISWKEIEDIEQHLLNESNKKDVTDKTKWFSDFIYDALSNKKIDPELRRYLTV